MDNKNNCCAHCKRGLIQFKGEHKLMYDARMLHETCKAKLKKTNPKQLQIIMEYTRFFRQILTEDFEKSLRC